MWRRILTNKQSWTRSGVIYHILNARHQRKRVNREEKRIKRHGFQKENGDYVTVRPHQIQVKPKSTGGASQQGAHQPIDGLTHELRCNRTTTFHPRLPASILALIQSALKRWQSKSGKEEHEIR